ncbi:MAG TPA: hypothetical protein ENO23_05130, partial [Alphaproteobacteria bacterium]|nr:hypothetical protein [Alphaproteobacteria bacterium]
MKRSHLIALAVILAAALLLRLVPAVRCDARPDFSDMARYNEAALGHELEEPLPPGYPLFLRGIYALFGARNYRAVFVAQALISAFTVLVIFHVTRQLGGVAPA